MQHSATIEDVRPQFSGPAILCDNLVKIYSVAGLEVVALQGLDLRVEPGEIMAIVGASGSGKSTLMNILGGLDTPSAGRAVVAGVDLGRLNERGRARYRRRTVGFVWQQTERNSLPYLTAQANVELPMLLDGVGAAERAPRATELLDLVGLDPDRRDLFPGTLSGGEQQRLAVAIALANRPAVLLADEPTGRLDPTSAAELFAALRRVNDETGTSIVLVTHDPLVAGQVRRTIAIRDGRTSTETLRRAQGDRSVSGGLTGRPGGDGTGATVDGAGAHEDHVAEEFAVLDAAGRLQLPRSLVEALGLKDRVRLRLEADHIEVWPDDASRVPDGRAKP